MDWIWGLNHDLQHITSQNPSECPTSTTGTVRPSISVWGCILMTTSQSEWCWNTLFMYKEDLLWVWTWCSCHSLQHETQVDRDPTCKSSKYQLWPLATVAGAETLYIYKLDLLWVWSGWVCPIITYTNCKWETKSSPMTATVKVKPSIYQVLVAITTIYDH
jgi:hypothetical protein